MGSKVEFEFPTEEQKKVIRQHLGTNKDDIRQALANVRNWLQVQPHLPNVIDDDLLERMYISCKCRTEKVKEIIDGYYTLKNKFPELLLNRDPLGDDIKEILKVVKIPSMPRLTPEFNRVGVLTGIDPDPSNLVPLKAVKASLMVVNHMLCCDYSIGYILLIDLRNVTTAHVTKMTVRDVRALEVICTRALSKRIKAIHFINAPKVISLVLSIVKPALPAKLQKRIFIHEPDSQSLFDCVPKYCVPNELGGSAGSAADVMDTLCDMMVKRRDWFLKEDKYVADESKRPSENEYSYDLFGVDGSFKKLLVD